MRYSLGGQYISGERACFVFQKMESAEYQWLSEDQIEEELTV